MRKGKIYQPHFTILVNSERKKGRGGEGCIYSVRISINLTSWPCNRRIEMSSIYYISAIGRGKDSKRSCFGG